MMKPSAMKSPAMKSLLCVVYLGTLVRGEGSIQSLRRCFEELFEPTSLPEGGLLKAIASSANAKVSNTNDVPKIYFDALPIDTSDCFRMIADTNLEQTELEILSRLSEDSVRQLIHQNIDQIDIVQRKTEKNTAFKERELRRYRGQPSRGDDRWGSPYQSEGKKRRSKKKQKGSYRQKGERLPQDCDDDDGKNPRRCHRRSRRCT